MLNKKTYRLNSFFSGIGGFDIAFENKGFTTQMLCEINPFCNQILNRHWPDTLKMKDINSIEVSQIPDAEVWCGGFPCQDISVARGASERLGLAGHRSGLFFQFAHLIAQKNPEVVVVENVGGLFNSNKGRDFGVILQTLSSLGYSIAWRLLNSRYFGVPQSRTRVYLCCWKNNAAKALDVMFDKEGSIKPKNARKDFLTEASEKDEYPKVPHVAYCLAASSGRHTGTDWSRTYVVCENGVRRLSPVESERLQGFPDNWTIPLGMGVDIDEKIDTFRYTAIGNAVSVPVVEWIANKIHLNLSKESTDEPIEQTLSLYKDFKKMRISDTLLWNIDFGNAASEYKWAHGGIVLDGKCYECDAYPTPSSTVETSLLPLIEKNQNNAVYFLTPNAAEGILRRVDNQKRTLFAPLREGLERLKSQNIK